MSQVEPTWKLNRPFLAAAIFAVLAVVALQVDVSIASYARGAWRIGDLRRLIDISEVFAHGLGVLMILITVYVLDPRNRRKLFRVATCAYGAGMLAQLTKLLVPRVRPRHFDFSGDVFSSFFAASRDSSGPMAQLTGRAIESFPSGHAATAIGLAFGLAWLYPRGKWLFASFAILATVQRIQSSAHFPSDTLAAAAIACMVAGLCLDDRVFGQFFSRLERKTEGRPKHSAGDGPLDADEPERSRRVA